MRTDVCPRATGYKVPSILVFVSVILRRISPLHQTARLRNNRGKRAPCRCRNSLIARPSTAPWLLIIWSFDCWIPDMRSQQPRAHASPVASPPTDRRRHNLFPSPVLALIVGMRVAVQEFVDTHSQVLCSGDSEASEMKCISGCEDASVVSLTPTQRHGGLSQKTGPPESRCITAERALLHKCPRVRAQFRRENNTFRSRRYYD